MRAQHLVELLKVLLQELQQNQTVSSMGAGQPDDVVRAHVLVDIEHLCTLCLRVLVPVPSQIQYGTWRVAAYMLASSIVGLNDGLW